MATILIVDDLVVNRDVLKAMLRPRQHRFLEASDGADALALARRERPDLIITDVLMPTMDGYELVRQLRADPALAGVPVIFCTAHYHEHEAQRLAASCGVTGILSKPCELDAVLRAVDDTLHGTASPGAVEPQFERDHLRLLTDKLSEAATDLQTTNERLEALIDIGLNLATERDPVALLEAYCRAARELLGARYAALAVWDDRLPDGFHLSTSGLRSEVTAKLRQDLRAAGTSGRPATLPWPASHPPADAVLSAPIASLLRTYGWLYLADRIGGPAFSQDDERLARILSGQVGRVYENGSLLKEAQQHAAQLAAEVAERRRAEETLLHAQKMEAVGQLAGGVAHDFNNLLTAIFGYTELLESALGEAHPRYKDLQQIRKASTRATHLTRQLLAFSRRQVLQPKTIDVNLLVTDLANMLRRLIRADVDLQLALDPALHPIKADVGQIEQVVMNLVVNARDAMPRGGRVVIETRNRVVAGEHLVALVVTDTGTGMDAATRTRIFEPFFTTKPRGQGTGLGLATVYGIVKQSGGTIAVDSEAGRGTTFTILLPRADARAARTQPAPALLAPQGRGDERILLVEDAPEVRELVGTLLERQGYDVRAADDAEMAMQLVREAHTPFDLLVTDVVLPGPSGPELFARLRVDQPLLRVLYLSGYTDEAVASSGGFSSGTPFLQKPFSASELARKLREVLDAEPVP